MSNVFLNVQSWKHAFPFASGQSFTSWSPFQTSARSTVIEFQRSEKKWTNEPIATHNSTVIENTIDAWYKRLASTYLNNLRQHTSTMSP